MSLFKLLVRSYRALPARYRKQGLVACVLLTMVSFAELLSLGSVVPVIPLLASPAKAIHEGVGARIAGFLGIGSPLVLSLVVLGGIVLIFAVKNLFAQFVNHYQASFVYRVFQDQSTRLYRHYLHAGLLALRSRPSAEVARDIVGVTHRFAASIVLAFLLLLTEVVVLFMISAGIILYEPLAFLVVAAALLPLFGVFYLKVKRVIQRTEARLNELDAQLSMTVFQSLFGYTDVVATGSREFFLRRYSKLAVDYGHGLKMRAVLGLIPARLAEVSTVLGIAVLYLYSTVRIPDVSARLTLFGVYLIAAYRILPSANRITLCLLSIRGNSYALDTMEAAEKAAPIPDAGKAVPISFREGIRFENVEFRYPGAVKPVLEKVSLSIRKGECLGLVGPSGSGKSTFLNLLLGLLEPTAGAIQVDGIPLSVANLESWRHLVGYVQQEVFVLDGTVRENIAFGVEPEDLDPARLDRAVALSALTDLIRSLPNGLATEVAERGAKLSVGQKQRLGIARALYHGAEMIVFDEATSALDSDTEREIGESIRKLKDAGCTIVIVSHREQPLTICERIVRIGDRTLGGVN